MVSCLIEVPAIPNLLKEADKILVSRGLTRRTIIKGDTLQAVGEAGIGLFYLVQMDKSTIKIEARNKEAFDIITNLLTVELRDLKEKFPELEADERLINKGQLCSVCKVPLEFLDKKLLWDGLNVKIMACPKCNKLEFYRV